MSLQSQALSGLRWTASARLASQVTTWAITLVVVRLLTPGDYGLLAMATVFVSFLEMFSDFGLGAALVQKPDVEKRLLRQAFGLIVAIHLGLAALLVLAAPLIAAFYDEPRVTTVLQVLSLQFILAGFAVIPDAQLQRRMEFRSRSLLDLSSAIVGSVTTLAMAFSGAGVWALVAGSMVSRSWKTIGINWLSPFLHWPEFSLDEVRSLLRFGTHITLASVCWMLFSQLDVLICAKLLGREVLGYYSVAMQLAALPVGKVMGLVNQVAFPTFSRMQSNPDSVSRNVQSGIRILSFFAFPILWGISSVAPEIVDVILGSSWKPATAPLQMLALAIPLRMLALFTATAVQGIGRSDIVVRNAFWSLLFGAPAFFIGARWGGLLGLSVAWLIVSPLVSLQGLIRGLPALGLGLRHFAAAIVPAARVTLVMYGAVALARQVPEVEHFGAIRLSVLIAAGALVYCFGSLAFNRAGTREILQLIRNIVLAKTAQPSKQSQ